MQLGIGGLRNAEIGHADCVQGILIHSVDKPDPGWSVVWSTLKTNQHAKVFALSSRRSHSVLQAMLGVGWRSE